LRYIKYSLVLILLGFLFASCEKEDSSVIDPVKNFPIVISASVNPAVFDTNTVHAVAVANISSVDPVKNVIASVTDPNNISMGSFSLHDDGIAPDQSAGDNIYTGYIDFSMTCRLIGNYKTEFRAETEAGLFSGIVTQNIELTKSHNLNPIISDLIIPDSLQRPSGNELNIAFLQIKVTDPDGLCDIQKSYFNSFKPDGSPSSGNPFSMFDDGDIQGHCDSTAGDGKYSLCIAINSQANIGYYKFLFNAKDRSDSTSNTLTDSIYVY
jgi:hypothetical protein